MKTKTITEITNPENFNKLKGYLLLFDRESRYYSASGFVIRADCKDNKYSLIVKTQGVFVFEGDYNELKEMLDYCIEFAAPIEDDSFILER